MLDAQIVDLMSDAELEEEIGRAVEYLEKIQTALLKIHKALRAAPTRAGLCADATHELAHGGPTNEATGNDPLVSADCDKHGTEFAHERTGPPYRSDAGPGGAAAGGKVKLPKITLPRFKGNPIYWMAFCGSYESAVCLIDALSDVDKFIYLHSLLEKSAYDAIARLTLSSAKYQEAINILKKCFGDRQIIISRHMYVLLNLTAVMLEPDCCHAGT